MAKGYKQIGPDDGRPFVKGDKRINREGRPRKLPELDAILADILGEEQGNTTVMAQVIKALVAKALKGDVRASELIMDRSYGKLKNIASVDMTLSQLGEADLDRIIEKLTSNNKSDDK